jgi:PAS domain S-box-containing protein
MLSESVSGLKDLQQLIHQLPVPMILLEGKSGIVQLVNRQALQMIGRSEYEVLNKSIDQLQHELQNGKDIYQKVFVTGTSYKNKEVAIEFPVNNKFHTVFFDHTWSPWYDANGNIKGVILTATDVTERIITRNATDEDRTILQQTAMALVQTEARYRHYMEQSSEGIWRIEVDAPVDISLPMDEQISQMYKYAFLAECNSAMAKMYGYAEPNDITGKRLYDFLPQNDDSFAYLSYFIQSGYRLEGTESKEIDKDGNTKYFLNNLVGVLENGQLVRAWGSQLDITEQKKIEEQLRLANEQLELTFQNIPSALYLFDKNGQLKYLNNNAAKLYGNYSAKELLSNNDLVSIMKIANEKYERFDEDDKLLDPDDTPVGIALRTGRATVKIIKVVDKQSKDVTWFYSQAAPLLDEENNISLVLGTATDITLQKEAEEKTKQNEQQQRLLNEQLENLVKQRTTQLEQLNNILLIQNETFNQAEESSKQGSYSFNLSTGVLSYSDNLYNLLGFEPGEFQPSLDEFNRHVHPDDRDYVTAAASRVLQTKQADPWRYRMIKKDGTVIQILATGRIISLNNESLLVGTLQDITELTTSENLLKEKNLELQQTIDELHHRQLKDEQKDNFIAMASHELKTPITSMKGYVQLLLNEYNAGNEKSRNLSPLLVRSSLINIEKQIARLTRLISELLDLTKIETGTLELKKELFSLNELVIEVVEDILYTNPNKEINIYHDLKTAIYADRDRIGQVISNLLSNAIKYSPANKRIGITVFGSDKGPSLSVTDYGIGIDSQDHEKIFERFYRTKDHNAQTYPGFGIGLFIVKEFIQRHGGTVTVKSKKGEGSTFTFTLPATDH